MTPVDYEVSVADTQKAWKAICRAVRRHHNAHGEYPSKLFVSMAGIAAIQYGVLDGMEDEIQIVAVAHWLADTTLTIA